MPKRAGRPSVAQTPAPKSDKIYGSNKNPKGSATEKKSKSIKLSNKTIDTLKEKLDSFIKSHPSKKNVDLNDLKAVYRRGSGAYSKSHRPTITEGKPNSRAAWSYARVNKFLKKAGGDEVKAAYVQDDDLLENGGILLDNLNPTGSIFSDYSADKIDQLPLGENITTYDKTAGINPDEKIIVYRGSTKKTDIKSGDFVTTNYQLAKDYAGKGVVLSKEVRADEILDDSTEPLGEEYILRLKKYANGGLIAPNGKPSNLKPQQYELVRTSEFKAWFGDWENDPENASKVVDDNGEPKVMWHYAKRLKNHDDKFYEFRVNKQLGSHFGTISQAKNIKYIPEKIEAEQLGMPINTTVFANEDISDFRYYQVFLNIRNPIRLRDIGIFEITDLLDKIDMSSDDFEFINNRGDVSYYDRGKELVKLKGFDGVVYLNRYESEANIKLINSLDDSSDAVFKKYTPSSEDSWIAFYPQQIKLADGTNITFDGNNPDIRFSDGGDISQHITCINCGWEWETVDSAESDKYVCHQCGFDNSLFYDGGLLKPTMSLDQIAEKHGVDLPYLQNQLENGKKHEMEHTDNESMAEKIALHHIAERPDYYDVIEKMNLKDGGVTGDYDSLTNEMLSQKIKIFLEKVSPYKFYYVDRNINSLIIGFGEELTLENAEKIFAQATSSMEFFDADNISMKYYPENNRTIFTIKLKKEVEFEDGGETESDIVFENNVYDEIEISEFLKREIKEADDVIHCSGSRLFKFMICKAKTELCEKRMSETENPEEQNAWNECKNIWGEHLNMVLQNNIPVKEYKDGGSPCGCGRLYGKGGLAYGNSHDKGGIPLVVKSTNQNIEIEGGEGVVNKRSMQMNKMVEFEGEEMTPCEVISKINQMGGGVKFKCSDVSEIIAEDGHF